LPRGHQRDVVASLGQLQGDAETDSVRRTRDDRVFSFELHSRILRVRAAQFTERT
jgi:hypothetical protein